MLFLLAAVYLLSSCYAHDNHQEQRLLADTRHPDWTSQRMMHGYNFNAEPKKPKKRFMGSEKNGKALFIQSCAPCHGLTGVGDGKQAKFLDAKPADLTKYPPWHQSRHFFILISVGTKSGMPGWQDLLSQRQIADVIAYIQTL
ncbi:MAG: cytochrome c [Oligoflexales bacterium]